MSHLKPLEQSRLKIDAGYQISIQFLSEDPVNQKKFLKELSETAAKKGEGTHHVKINGIHVKYSALVTSLSVNLKMKEYNPIT